MLGRHRRRRPNIRTTLSQRLQFAGLVAEVAEYIKHVKVMSNNGLYKYMYWNSMMPTFERYNITLINFYNNIIL